MPHFQTKDLEETSKKQHRVYVGGYQRIAWRDLQVGPGLWEPWTHRASYLLRVREVGDRTGEELGGEGWEGC